jgi:hypothetical protein
MRTPIAIFFMQAATVVLMLIVAALFYFFFPSDMARIQRRLDDAQRLGQCIEIRRDNGTVQGLIERYCPYSTVTVTPTR